VFDHGEVTTSPLPTRRTGAQRATVESLRERMQGMQDGLPRLPIAMPPELSGLVQLRSGGAYRVDDPGLALALLAAPSAAGGWTALIGIDDLGVEAAEESGLDLTRTVLVPAPGPDWLEVTAALVDVVPLVLLRPPAGVPEQALTRTASRLGARLRKRASTLLVQGPWPGCEARLGLAGQQWQGVEEGAGHGRLVARRVQVRVQRGSAPPRTTSLWLPAVDAPLRAIEPVRRVHGAHGETREDVG
jgi:hypothetical protein